LLPLLPCHPLHTQLGCPEFTLLVVLLCAGLAQQQLRAVHVYAHSISRVFTGA
jgi:hypothetical protein